MGRWMRMLARAGLAAVLLVTVAGTGAQGAEGPPEDFRISGPGATSDDWEPAVAWNYSNDEYLVVWADWRSHPAPPTAIYGQRVSATGSGIESSFRISGPGATGYSLEPAVAWNDSTHEYLVVWQDPRNYETRGIDIYGQRVSATGSLLGSNFRVVGTGASGDEVNPAVVWNQTLNEYLVVWEDGRDQFTRQADVYAQRVSAGGERLDSETRISGPSATDFEFAPAVAWNSGANEYLIVWADGRNHDTRGGDIYGQRLTGAGSRAGSNFRISGPGATANDFSPAIAWNGRAGEYLVVWGDTRNDSTRGTDVYAQRVSAAGGLLSSNLRVVGPGAGSEDQSPAVVWNDTTRQYMVVWEDGRNEPTRGSDIFGQRLSTTGTRVGPDFQVSGPGATSDDGDPAVAWDDTANRYLVVWEDGRNEPTRGTDIYGQRVGG
jgi:hypothetical protein